MSRVETTSGRLYLFLEMVETGLLVSSDEESSTVEGGEEDYLIILDVGGKDRVILRHLSV